MPHARYILGGCNTASPLSRVVMVFSECGVFGMRAFTCSRGCTKNRKIKMQMNRGHPANLTKEPPNAASSNSQHDRSYQFANSPADYIPGSNKVFLLQVNNGREAIARLPCPLAGPPFLGTASEVAITQFARESP